MERDRGSYFQPLFSQYRNKMAATSASPSLSIAAKRNAKRRPIMRSLFIPD